MSETIDTEVLPPQETGITESQERAQIDIQIQTARRYPRPALSKIKDRMLSFATLDEETAASCFYKLPRGGSMIEGPSVRLAEITAACYGNMRIATRTLETVPDGNNPHVTVQVAIHDLECNLAVQVEKRRRITKKKNKPSPDEDDINLATNACASIALRDAIFRVVPNVLVSPVFEACKKIAVGKVTSLSERRTKLLQRLAQMGVPESRVLASMNFKKVEDMGAEAVEELIGRGTALKDGAAVEEIFPIEQTSQAPTQGQAAAPSQAVNATAATDAPNQQTFIPAPTNQTEDSPQVQLEKIVLAGGYTFDEFVKFGNESGAVPDASSLATFSKVPEAVARRLIRAGGAGVISGLKRLTGK